MFVSLVVPIVALYMYVSMYLCVHTDISKNLITQFRVHFFEPPSPPPLALHIDDSPCGRRAIDTPTSSFIPCHQLPRIWVVLFPNCQVRFHTSPGISPRFFQADLSGDNSPPPCVPQRCWQKESAARNHFLFPQSARFCQNMTDHALCHFS